MIFILLFLFVMYLVGGNLFIINLCLYLGLFLPITLEREKVLERQKYDEIDGNNIDVGLSSNEERKGHCHNVKKVAYCSKSI